ncbi:DUF6338 family protein [Nocardia sp. NPDC004568]|uniref:DUF6338 family protein n=1 Tax=Nocardia sp. NPDC004568 TaxID=3154551 RepID=UPI0033A8BCA6
MTSSYAISVGFSAVTTGTPSAAFGCVYAVLLGPWLLRFGAQDSQGALGYMRHPQLAAATVAVLAFVIPAGAAVLSFVRLHWGWPLATWVAEPDAKPSAWDVSAPYFADCFVRIHTADNRWVGGYLPDGTAFVSTHPEPRDIFIPEPWQMGARASFSIR